MKGPVKSAVVCLPACLPVCLSVRQFVVFLRNGLLVFSDFCAPWQIIGISKNSQSPFYQENVFLPKFGQKGLNMAAKTEAFRFFEKVCHQFSLKIIHNENEYICQIISGRILGLKLCSKMLSANQIAGFFKMYCLKKEVNDEVFYQLTITINLGVCNQASLEKHAG